MALLVAPRSFRWRFLLVVFAAAVVPLALMGFWLTRSVVSAGESLLRSELDSSLTKIAASLEQQWTYRSGQLVLLAQNEAAQRALAALPAEPFTRADSTYLAGLFVTGAEMIPSVEYRSAGDRVRWSMSRISVESADEGRATVTTMPAWPMLIVRLPVGSEEGRPALGEMTARVRLDFLLPADTALRPTGAVLQVVDRATHATLLAARVPDSLLLRDRFSTMGAEWIASRRPAGAAPIDLIIAAPTRRYVQPFERAARNGALAVAVVALFAIATSAYLTKRLTGALEELAVAADAVARGDLDHHVEGRGTDEVQRVATAFNSMTANLRRTLGELSHRQALAAVGEYATSLSHEIRNALTAVRIDLQSAEEKTPADVAGRPLVTRALRHVKNLDATVTRSLQLARSGRAARHRIDLRNVLVAATRSAAGTFAERGGILEPVARGNGPVWIRGEAPALEQLFLNLLLNSAQALQPGGSAVVTLHIDGASACVVVSDSGKGISAEDLPRVLDPFFSTKGDGTGLGLPLARQIAAAHGGSLRIESDGTEGTHVEVRLPLA
ncbi:MAG TPA: HAMP domain-containing sensor histidine kinase [Gemmatimonadaceae bacterium]|nr:HAMP domain-containing sensor histidine kinase [Gemmatimonadaceae bacterium]